MEEEKEQKDEDNQKKKENEGKRKWKRGDRNGCVPKSPPPGANNIQNAFRVGEKGVVLCGFSCFVCRS